jgi:circadian clock protein KaiC
MKKTTLPRKPPAASVPQKMPTGITGLDEITRGGLPRDRNTVLLGGPGCGKTVLALQILVNGARLYREPGIFVAFEENTRQIVLNASSFGWNLAELERKNLFFFDARIRPENITAGDFDLEGFLAVVGAKAKKMGAKRIVFDSIDVLLALLDNLPRERQEIHRLLEWLNTSGLTGIVTSKHEEGSDKTVERYGFLQFMADCAIQLRQQTPDQVSQRDLRIIKYRGSAFAENAAPMVIGQFGVEVANISATDRSFPVSRKRVSTGVDRLNAMLGGGYYRGASVLITGAPGTAKSTLSGSFLAAACRSGERALYVSFDEIAGEHARNMASVNIDLDSHLESGLLKIYSARTEASSLEEHLVRIYSLIREHRARFVVFDPLSSLFRAGAQSSVQSTSERLLHKTKAEGITTISTSLLASPDARIEGTPLEVSTIADTWIHLSYAVQAGERNRALTIVKSRGMKHSNQVRELVLSDNGVTLADVYTADGEVLMGTMRWQREMSEKSDLERARLEVRRKEQEVKVAETELNVRIEALRRELEAKQFELAASTRAETRRLDQLGHYRIALRRSRGADQESPVKKKRGSRS